MGKLISIIGWAGIVLFVLLCGTVICVYATFSVYGACDGASEAALRVLVPAVRAREKQELATIGTVGDIDARLRSESPGLLGLGTYRVVIRRVAKGYDAVVEPTGWRFCRSTYILHDGGDRVEVVPPNAKARE